MPPKKYMLDGKVECSTCKTFKITEDFFKSKNKTFGIEASCKICNTAKKKERNPPKEKPTHKTCKECGFVGLIEEFPKWKLTCTPCTSKRRMALPSHKGSSDKSNKKKSAQRRQELTELAVIEYKNILENDTESEIWKDIPNYNGKYQASNSGRIRCMPMVYTTTAGKFYKIDFYYPKDTNIRGYKHMSLVDFEGNKVNRGVHRWVMYAFHGESELQVDHINGIKDDNRLENLRYCTSRENNHYEKQLNPDRYTSPLIGAYWQKTSWYSYLTIEGKEYYIGSYSTDTEASAKFHEALKNWEEKGELPPKYINPNKTSRHDGIDFHGASQKWRVRITDIKLYIGIFETEEIALRVLNICLYLYNKDVTFNKELLKRIRRKYGKDNRFNRLIRNKVTGEVFYGLTEAGNSIGMNPMTLSSQLEGIKARNTTDFEYIDYD